MMRTGKVLGILLATASPVMWGGTPASFPGDVQAYVREQMQYPALAAGLGIEGCVEVAFTITADGLVRDARVVHPIDMDLEEEALRLVRSMPAWTPAKDDSGNPVEETATLTIEFNL